MNRPGTLFPRGAATRAALRRAGVLTAIGFVGLMPAAILVGTSLLGMKTPRWLVHPVLVLGGLLASLAASFVAVTHWELSSERHHLRLICTIRKRPADLVALAAGLALLGSIMVYLFVENYQAR